MQKTNTHVSNRVNTSPQRKKREGLLLAYCLLFSVPFFASVVISSLSAASKAHAQFAFPWTAKQNEKQANDLLKDHIQTPLVASQLAKHEAAFGEIAYYYFQHDYQSVLQLVAVGNTKHGFTELTQDDTDRLNLMQGAAQLKMGLYKLSQAKFADLLSQTTSQYVQANTWFFLAKAGFGNKQDYLSELAYEAIQANNLRENLNDQQWNELLYLTAYKRMQVDQDWQILQKKLPSQSIYTAYLFADKGTLLFNEAEYEQATLAFIQAKQALMAYKNRRGFITALVTNVYDSVTWAATPWRWFDSNASAQQAVENRQIQKSIEEQDALFDRINMNLGQSLLQQGELGNAIAVMQNIGNGGAESNQALLTYGWANARENRWQAATAAWQYLQQNSEGVFSLQASYGLAYAFSRQDNLGQAFHALQDTATKIDKNLQALDSFAATAQQDDFFTHYSEHWPSALDDLKLGFFTPGQGFDAKHLLDIRFQAGLILSDVNDKQARVMQLDTLLQEKQTTYNNRLQGMNLHDAKIQIDQTQQRINELKDIILQSDTFEKKLALSKGMADEAISSHLTRLSNANKRHVRLAADTSRKRPLKKSYKTRLQRIEGILKWQLMDNFIVQKWRHRQLLKQAQYALTTTLEQYNRLQKIVQNKDTFSQQHAQFLALNVSLNAQIQAANNVYETSTNTLTNQLLSLIHTRKAQLQEQGVNTRLAMLRIQDLQLQGGQQ